MLTHPTSLQGPKSVLHVQNCCFANLTLLLFWPSCCHCILTSEATTECVVRELTIYVGRITYIFKDKHVVLLFEHDTGKVLLKNKKFRSRLRINSSRYSLLYLHSLDGQLMIYQQSWCKDSHSYQITGMCTSNKNINLWNIDNRFFCQCLF